jgi:hypothetical protein
MSLWHFRLSAILIYLAFLLICLVMAAPAMFSPWDGLMVTLHNQSGIAKLSKLRWTLKLINC